MARKERRYLLDANVFIEANDRYYSFETCPGFWKFLLAQHKAKRIFSVDRVRKELTPDSSKFKEWIEKELPSEFFLTTDEDDIAAAFGKMVQWAQGENFQDRAKAEFAASPDGWLVACASVANFTVVTHEVYEPNTKKKVKIPNVCKEFGVPYVDTFEMLKDLGAVFTWRPPR